MKRNLFGKLTTFLLLAFMLGFVGCNDEDVDPSIPEIRVESESMVEGVIDVGAAGEANLSLNVIANRKWIVDIKGDLGDPAWLVVTPNEGKGNQKVTVTILPNTGIAREAKIFFNTAIAQAPVEVKQAGDGSIIPDQEIIKITFGKDNVSTNPWVHEFTGDWGMTGIGIGEATITGATASLRTSGKLSDYPGASASNHLFFGAIPSEFVVNKIAASGFENFKIKFGANYYHFDTKDGVFKPEYIDVYVGTSETTLTKIEYVTTTAPLESKYWYYNELAYSAPAGTEYLYFKAVCNQPSNTRLDDFLILGVGAGQEAVTKVIAPAATQVTETTATVGGSYTLAKDVVTTEVGVEYKIKTATDWVSKAAAAVATPFTVELTALTKGVYTYRAYIVVEGEKVYSSEIEFTTGGDTPEPANAIYFENVGTSVEKVGTAWPFVDVFTGWIRKGDLDQSAVTYSGYSASVRNSGAGYQPADGSASGQPYAFLGTVGAGGEIQNFQISEINVTGFTNLTFSTMVSFQESYTGGPVWGNINSSSFKIEGSVDGTAWTALTFNDAAAAMWAKITTEFKVAEGTTKLYIKISEPSLASSYRFDDFTLINGGSGTVVIGGGGVTPVETKVTTTVATDVAAEVATVGGSYVLGTGKTATAVGVEYRVTGTEAWTTAAAAAVATPFTVALTGLTVDTNYDYHAYVTVDGNKVVGTDLTFATYQATVINKTVAQLLAEFVNAGTIAEGVKLTATVVSDITGNNLHGRSIAVTDGNVAGSGIILRTAATHTYNAGDLLEIDLSNTTYNEYSGLKQIELTEFTSITVKSFGNVVNPVVVSDLTKLADYQSMVVTIAGAQAVNTLGTMKGTHKFATQSGEFDVYTTNYATFIDKTLPTGNGSITGLVTMYNTPQVSPRTEADYGGLTGARFGEISFASLDFEPASVVVNTALAQAKVLVPYHNAKGTESYTVSVGVTGDGAAGIVGVTNVTKTITGVGSGVIELDITGTPTVAGTVTFTVTGITGLTANTVSVVVGTGDGPVYTSGVTFPVDNSTNAVYNQKATVNSVDVDVLKLGTGKLAGTGETGVLGITGEGTLVFYGVAWKDKIVSVKITVNNGGTIDGETSKEFTLNANAGATGNAQPYIMTVADSDKYTALLSGVTATTTLTIESVKGTGTDFRVILFGVNVK